MADPAQIANDLEAQARKLDRTGMDHLCKSMRRGAEAIRHLMAVNIELERAAQEEADAFERYRNGDDLYG